MPTARIYIPAKTAMQSGAAKTKSWVLEFEQASPKTVEPLMGWTSSADTRQQVRLGFPTKEEAIAYATRQGVSFRLEEPRETEIRPKSYAENFKFGRPERWTH